MIVGTRFISCDWGTTNFRLRVVDVRSLEVLEVLKTDQGAKTVFGRYKKQSSLTQEAFFLDYLHEQIGQLKLSQEGMPVVISGMASSTIGLRDLPYAQMPFGNEGNDLVSEVISSHGHDIVLVSGVRSDTGMMRGEEVQALGLEPIVSAQDGGVLLLPGTHSKHILYTESAYRSLKNFMTGEIFDLIANQSILSNSVFVSRWSEPYRSAFIQGVEVGAEGRLAESLFGIRAGNILQGVDKGEQYFKLSGMIIGDEVRYLADINSIVFLAAPERTSRLYELALTAVIGEERLMVIDSSTLDRALLQGQLRVLVLSQET